MPDYRVRTRLLAVSAVTDLVVDRIATALGELEEVPALVLSLDDDDAHSDLLQTAGGGYARVEIECWGRTYAEAKTLAAAVRTALVGADWWSAEGTPPISSCRIERSGYGGRTQLPGRNGWDHWWEQEYVLQYGD